MWKWNCLYSNKPLGKKQPFKSYDISLVFFHYPTVQKAFGAVAFSNFQHVTARWITTPDQHGSCSPTSAKREENHLERASHQPQMCGQTSRMGNGHPSLKMWSQAKIAWLPFWTWCDDNQETPSSTGHSGVSMDQNGETQQKQREISRPSLRSWIWFLGGLPICSNAVSCQLYSCHQGTRRLLLLWQQASFLVQVEKRPGRHPRNTYMTDSCMKNPTRSL